MSDWIDKLAFVSLHDGCIPLKWERPDRDDDADNHDDDDDDHDDDDDDDDDDHNDDDDDHDDDDDDGWG